jgi:hypothetical protein
VQAPLTQSQRIQLGIFSLIMYGGMAAGVVLNIFMINSFRERELVEFSYLWVPAIIFGGVGRFAIKNMGAKNPWGVAFIVWFIAVFLLFMFFQTIWQTL